jgi:ribokinase
VSAQRRPDFDLLVIGELNVDLLLYGDVTPVFGQAEKLVDDAVMTVGSSSAIFAHQAARLGLEVAFCGKVGADAFGTFMTDRLERAGIDTSAVEIAVYEEDGLTRVDAIEPEKGVGQIRDPEVNDRGLKLRKRFIRTIKALQRSNVEA